MLIPINQLSNYACHSSEVIDQLKESTEFTVVFPAENELQIDLDSEEAFVKFIGQLHLLCGILGVDDLPSEGHPSKSGLPKRHATVTLPFNVTAEQRIVLQVFCGSDQARELINYSALQNGDPTPTLFIERVTASVALDIIKEVA